MDDKRLERIEKKVDDLSDHLSSIDITLAAQHVSLREHIKRTALLEKEMAPVKKHVNMVHGAIRLIMLTASIVAVIESIKVFVK